MRRRGCHSGLPISRERICDVTHWPRGLQGQRVLEAGSGAGRFTEVLLAAGADVVSFDSSSAVDANASNIRDKGSLHLFQGGVFKIPSRPASFDKVLCLGLLQHTPDPAHAFSSLARYVKPVGQQAIDVYRRDAAPLLQWKYLLRPITKRIDKRALYRRLSRLTPPREPLAAQMQRVAGRFGARLMPIVQYAHLGLPPKLNAQWAVLDTFDQWCPNVLN